MEGIAKGTLHSRAEWIEILRNQPLFNMTRLILNSLSGYGVNHDQDRMTLSAALEAVVQIARDVPTWKEHP
jgi:hypothetical protein